MNKVKRYLHNLHYSTAAELYAWYASVMNEVFRRFSARIASVVGSARAFFLAVVIIVTWGLTGPIFHFSDTWQLIINTGTTIVTFLMVFVIQNTQNRDARSMQLKLDELIESIKSASNSYIDLEEMSDDELDKLREHFRTMHDKVQAHQAKKRKN